MRVPAAARPGAERNAASSAPRAFPGSRIWDTYLACVAFVWLELWVVAALQKEQFVSLAEPLLAQRTLLPLAALAVAPLAAVIGVAHHCLAASERRGPRLVLCALAGAFALVVGWGIGTGRHLAGARRPLFALVLLALAAGVAFAAAPWVPRLLRRARPVVRAGVVVALCAVGTLALEVANARVLPRLYPAFHTGLSVLTLAAASAATLAYGPLDSSEPERPLWRRIAAGRAALALGVFAISAALAPLNATKLRFADNVRFIYLENAPVLAHVVEIAARLDPPEPIEQPAPVMETASSGAFDLAGWDILLVSVDALRADHVGAYGYDRPTTPSMDALASNGVVFEAAYTPTPHTSYAVSSLMTGKFTRPLFAMDLGADSETWADHLRRYDYKTAAFYPPAVFFIDEARFTSLSERKLGFEYVREEFLPAAARTEQITHYLDAEPTDRRVFTWVHLFEPHEPYEAHEGFDFGSRDIDRYDAEISETDRALGEIVREVRARRPKTLVIVTADHGEEFGDHGGRYHGTTVYEEQVRVPLIVNAPGLLEPRRIVQPVQLVDLLPTVLAALRIPRPARVRGRDLGDVLTGTAPDDRAGGIAFSESDDMTLLAKGQKRLVCLRRAGACALYDIVEDPRERRDIAAASPTELSALKSELRGLEASHGRYERQGQIREGKGLPEALRRGLSGDPEAAMEIGPLLDDADVAIRRKAAEVLFELGKKEVAPALRLAITREEDAETKAYVALALVRIGEGAPHVFELVTGKDETLRRLAALALAESGDDRGEDELVAWWRAAFPKSGRPAAKDAMSFERARQVLDALAALKSEIAVGSLLQALDDVRLRPFIAKALARIGEDAARPGLAEALFDERYVTSRVAITEALLSLGAGPELRNPLVSMLGMPDPLPNGVSYVLRADMLKHVGGPAREAELGRLQRFATSGVLVDFVVPELPKGAQAPAGGSKVRVICRARAPSGGEIRVAPRGDIPTSSEKKAPIPRNRPELDTDRTVTLALPAGEGPAEVFGDIPASVGAKPGKQASLVFYVTQGVEIEACLLVPLRLELPKR